jgi:hypothetical protein
VVQKKYNYLEAIKRINNNSIDNKAVISDKDNHLKGIDND